MDNSLRLDFDPPVELVSELFQEYAASLGVDLCFQGFAEELDNLPGRYARPAGMLVVAFVRTEVAGCGGFRPITGSICEMKRLYIRPDYRGLGLGRQIAEALLDQAKNAGYEAIRLDTLASMSTAIALYRSMGFQSIAPYYENPILGSVYLEADLTSRATALPSPQVL